jgi:hypothetical protein
MDEKTKFEIDTLLEIDRGRQTAFEDVNGDHVKRDVVALQKFKRLRSEIIAPAMREIAELAAASGWKYSLSEQDETTRFGGRSNRANICATFSRGGAASGYSSSSLPNFIVAYVKHEDSAEFYESTLGSGHGGTAGRMGSVKLDAITYEFIQSRLVQYMKNLIEDSRPASYSQNGGS